MGCCSSVDVKSSEYVTAQKLCIVDTLPEGAVMGTIREVPAAGTLVIDGKSVHGLGFEDADKWAEALRYTRRHCRVGQQAYTVADPAVPDVTGQPLLRHIYVLAVGNNTMSYLCVNKGLLAHGLARYNSDHRNIAAASRQALLAAVGHSVSNRLGRWGQAAVDLDAEVVITADDQLYHLEGCPNIASGTATSKLTVKTALSEGRNVCKECEREMKKNKNKNKK